MTAMSDPTEPRPAASPGEVLPSWVREWLTTHTDRDNYTLSEAHDALDDAWQALASLLGSGDDDQRGEGDLLRAYRGADQAAQSIIAALTAERDAEKARTDAAVEALRDMEIERNMLRVALRALLPADTTEDGPAQ